MVLFLCVAALVFLLVSALANVKLFFCAELLERTVRLTVRIGLLFGAVGIPVEAEHRLFEPKANTGKREKAKSSGRKRLLRFLLRWGKKSGALQVNRFHCRGAVGNAQDAFLTVMGAGSAAVFLDMLSEPFLHNCEKNVRIIPTFEKTGIWIYMEGIAQLHPLQIIGAMIRRKGD